MAEFHVQVKKIVPQLDEYRLAKGDELVTDTEFWHGTKPADDVKHFKRFVVQLEVRQGQRRASAQLLISLRGGLLTLSGSQGLDVPLRDLFNAINLIARRFDYAIEASGAFRGTLIPLSVGETKAPVAITDQSDRKAFFATTGDPYWFADVLHHVRDAGGFNHEGRLPLA